ncbi:SANT/Myb domain [Fusarium oxysporum f. sp. vasinfectum]|nr:SANT/Myb domain [Fusarium oxysporum f. sp. vasinfectum]
MSCIENMAAGRPILDVISPSTSRMASGKATPLTARTDLPATPTSVSRATEWLATRLRDSDGTIPTKADKETFRCKAVEVDFAALLKASGSYEPSVLPLHQIRRIPALTYQQFSLKASPAPRVASTQTSGRHGMPPHAADQPPVKKRGKWSREENALIIKLRRCNTTWNNISNHLLGRSATGCRQHYQAHLEGRSEGDEELKNKPARLYERSKSEMRAKVAEVMAVPRPTAEAMQWQLGEADMARRTGAIPSSLAAVNVDRNYNFLSSPLPRELNSQHSSLQNDDFPCVVAVQHPGFCDKSFPTYRSTMCTLTVAIHLWTGAKTVCKRSVAT